MIYKLGYRVEYPTSKSSEWRYIYQKEEDSLLSSIKILLSKNNVKKVSVQKIDMESEALQ